MPGYSSRTCWWCGTQLMLGKGPYYAQDHDGNQVQVHKRCEPYAQLERKPLTAQPTNGSLIFNL